MASSRISATEARPTGKPRTADEAVAALHAAFADLVELCYPLAESYAAVVDTGIGDPVVIQL